MLWLCAVALVVGGAAILMVAVVVMVRLAVGATRRWAAIECHALNDWWWPWNWYAAWVIRRRRSAA